MPSQLLASYISAINRLDLYAWFYMDLLSFIITGHPRQLKPWFCFCCGRQALLPPCSSSFTFLLGIQIPATSVAVALGGQPTLTESLSHARLCPRNDHLSYECLFLPGQSLNLTDVPWGHIFLRVSLPTTLEKHVNYSHYQSPFGHLKHNLPLFLAFSTWTTACCSSSHLRVSTSSNCAHLPTSRPTLSLPGQWYPSFPSYLPVTLWAFKWCRTSSPVLTPRMPPPSNALGHVRE